LRCSLQTIHYIVYSLHFLVLIISDINYIFITKSVRKKTVNRHSRPYWQGETVKGWVFDKTTRPVAIYRAL